MKKLIKVALLAASIAISPVYAIDNQQTNQYPNSNQIDRITTIEKTTVKYTEIRYRNNQQADDEIDRNDVFDEIDGNTVLDDIDNIYNDR